MFRDGYYVGLGSLPMWRLSPLLTFRVFSNKETTVSQKRQRVKRESFTKKLPATTTLCSPLDWVEIFSAGSYFV